MPLDAADEQHLKEYKSFLEEIDSWMECSVKDARKESVLNCIAMIEAKRNI
jgi:hypothetical protein